MSARFGTAAFPAPNTAIDYPMEIVSTTADLRARVRAWHAHSERIAFVPTMGNLHAGHLKLVRHARGLAARVVVSIFVNPMQFGPAEDYATYPRTLEADTAALARVDADLVFTPPVAEIYPGDVERTTRVVVPGLSEILCGAFRPGFFTGVATVVTRLLNLVQPDIAVFGEKDYQQLILIRRMVSELCLPVDIEGVATEREPDGLAMSSRNGYLTPAERATAPALYRTLDALKTAVERGAGPYSALEGVANDTLIHAGFRPDYVSIRRAADLAEPGTGDRALRVLAAAWLGAARLIDNLAITVP
jgi:pantoate--beta-alanine ligase